MLVRCDWFQSRRGRQADFAEEGVDAYLHDFSGLELAMALGELAGEIGADY